MKGRVVLCVVLVVAACAGADSIGDRTIPESRSTEPASTVDSLISPTTAQASVGPFTQTLRRIDPRTLKISGQDNAPELGVWFSHAVDADRRYLALLSGADSYQGELEVFDLDWKQLSGPAAANDPHATLRVATSGDVYWLDAPLGPGSFRLMRLPVGAQDAEQIAVLPEGFSPYGLSWLSAKGDQYVVTGIVSEHGLAGGPAEIVRIETATGIVKHQPTNVTIGIVSGDDELDPVVSRYQPGLAVDEQNQTLLVVHADRDHLSVIDLDSLELVGETPISRLQSRLDRLFEWLIPPVQAKLSQGTSHTAVLGSDGLLYIASTNTRVEQVTDAEWVEIATPTGLRAIDPQTGVELERIDIPVNQVVMSPEGQLIASGTTWTYSEEGTTSTPSDLYLIAADTLHVTGQIGIATDNEAVRIEGLSASGDLVYVTSRARKEGQTTVHAIDVQTGRITGTHTGQNLRILPQVGLLSIQDPKN